MLIAKENHIFCIVKCENIYLFFIIFVAVFCCDWHIDCSMEVKIECIRCLDDWVDHIELCYKEE
jgi:hypothetical protein